MKNKSIILITSFFIIFSNYSFAHDSFEKWLNEFKAEAISKGISEKTLEVLNNAKTSEKTIKLDRNQPEFKLTFQKYKSKVVSDYRLKKAKIEYKKNKPLLDKIEKKYGVNGRLLVSLWAIESNFGSNMGKLNLFHTLASLAHDGRRSKFFRKELFNALMIIEKKMVINTNLKSGWAGAMGQCQFMPSSFLKYGVDENKDGKIDIWSDKEDIFASMANYLSKNGWNDRYIWGRAVSDKNFNETIKYNKKVKYLSEWSELGLHQTNGKILPKVDIKAKLLVIDKSNKNLFLVYDNFETLLKWNRSNYFALSVGILSDTLIN